MTLPDFLSKKLNNRRTTTIELNATLTPQDVFDISAAHLLQQGQRSLDENGHSCRYRSPDGLMCAFGPFIPEEVYSEEMEGKNANSKDIYPVTNLSSDVWKLALELQYLHDSRLYGPADWLRLLLALALEHGLNPKVLTYWRKVE